MGDVGTPEKEEEKWSGPKLVLLGLLTFGIVAAILYSISPYTGITLP